MLTHEIPLDRPADFLGAPAVDKNAVEMALDGACAKLLRRLDRFTEKFPATCSVNGIYPCDAGRSGFNWESGMLTGCYLLAYRHTGDGRFLDAAKRHIAIFAEAAEHPEWLNDHDTGFIFHPSCTAFYRLTGDEDAKKAALKAADILLDHCDAENHFIIRYGKRNPETYPGFRTLVDSMMNIPLFFFASEETGDPKYRDMAIGHYRTTIKYLIREDGSSFHHYQFDPTTGKPVGGVTLQGHSDASCWGRGHSWLLYGFPIAYRYTGNDDTLTAHRAVRNFFLNRLPGDALPYWDFDFTEGSPEPRDSSIAAIAFCGFDELLRRRPNEPDAAVLTGAMDRMLAALLTCADTTDGFDGLIRHVTHAVPQGQGIDGCAVYGDYFFLEALCRVIHPDWERYW